VEEDLSNYNNSTDRSVPFNANQEPTPIETARSVWTGAWWR